MNATKIGAAAMVDLGLGTEEDTLTRVELFHKRPRAFREVEHGKHRPLLCRSETSFEQQALVLFVDQSSRTAHQIEERGPFTPG
jgi:hypothetical protein